MELSTSEPVLSPALTRREVREWVRRRPEWLRLRSFRQVLFTHPALDPLLVLDLSLHLGGAYLGSNSGPMVCDEVRSLLPEPLHAALLLGWSCRWEVRPVLWHFCLLGYDLSPSELDIYAPLAFDVLSGRLPASQHEVYVLADRLAAAARALDAPEAP